MKPIEVIAAALEPGATDEQKKAAAQVCRNLAAVLDSAPGQPLKPQGAPAASSMPSGGNGLLETIQGLLSPQGAPVLDGLIARMREQLGDQANEASATARQGALQVPFVPLPTLGLSD